MRRVATAEMKKRVDDALARPPSTGGDEDHRRRQVRPVRVDDDAVHRHLVAAELAGDAAPEVLGDHDALVAGELVPTSQTQALAIAWQISQQDANWSGGKVGEGVRLVVLGMADVVVVNGEESTVNKRLCHAPGASGFVLAV